MVSCVPKSSHRNHEGAPIGIGGFSASGSGPLDASGSFTSWGLCSSTRPGGLEVSGLALSYTDSTSSSFPEARFHFPECREVNITFLTSLVVALRLHGLV